MMQEDEPGGPTVRRSCVQLPRRALEGSELDPWEALISE